VRPRGLLDEYELCRAKYSLSDEELASIATASILSSGAPADLKADAADRISRWLATL
jgi:adenosine deaminase